MASKPDELREVDVSPDPFEQFARWYQQALAAKVAAPDAMALATATSDGAPSARMVLLKGADERGLVFFTSYLSRKSRELEANRRAAMLFHWQPLGRQVRVEGTVERCSREETERYVRSRPPASQISALAWPQSEVVENREALEARVAELAARYGEEQPPVPDHWGGYRLVPSEWEFWQHREDRLHDRLRYRPAPGGGWTLERLGP